MRHGARHGVRWRKAREGRAGGEDGEAVGVAAVMVEETAVAARAVVRAEEVTAAQATGECDTARAGGDRASKGGAKPMLQGQG